MKDVPPVKTKQVAQRGTKRNLGDDHAEEILYLDFLRIENINVPREKYRATIWTNDMINKAIQLDTLPDDNFGALP
ncbi:hypothetical protein E2562_014148, partial [Oryza meyeriana var. granulata]